ncbi:MAG: radical SAM protein [Methanothrix sp.]|nr:radical SAM protein [Methanothrix sp.]
MKIGSGGRSEIALRLNPLWRLIANWLARDCKRCGQPVLYSIFDSFVDGRGPDCPGCSLAYRMASPLIGRIFRNTALGIEDLCRMFSDDMLRRSMHNVVRGIGHFGIRTPQPTAVPVVVVWNYTNRCNLNCLHCHQDSGRDQGHELSRDDAFRAIDRLGDAGVSILTFSGGEPLVRPDIFASVERATDAGMLCTIASNGLLMNRETVQRLKKAGIRRVEVGLDGCTPETHDLLRNSRGCFDAAVRAIEICVEAGFDEVSATMTLHSRNLPELSGTVELAERLGVDRFYLNRLIPAGRGRDVIGMDVSAAQRREALEYIYGKFHSSAISGRGVQCYCRGMTYYGRLGYERSDGQVFTVSEALSGYSKMWHDKFGTSMSGLIKEFAAGFGGCSAGLTYAGLSPGGDLLPCVPAEVNLGNILSMDIEEIWTKNKLLAHIRRRHELKGACGLCNFSYLCGGCRYTAYAMAGDWLAADPSCPYGPAQ